MIHAEDTDLRKQATRKRIAVESDCIRSVGYGARTRVLEVEFRPGGVYRYLGVPRDVYRELMDAESRGAYLNLHIKPNYQCYRVE